MTARRVVAVDPGLVTGLVNTFYDEDGCLAGFEALQLDHTEVGDYFAPLATTVSFQHGPPVIIIEKFTITAATAKNSQAPWSLETTGIVRYFATKAGIEPVSQIPSQVMKLCTDKVLKRAGMYAPGMEHSNDASRHSLYYAMTELGIMRNFLKEG